MMKSFGCYWEAYVATRENLMNFIKRFLLWEAEYWKGIFLFFTSEGIVANIWTFSELLRGCQVVRWGDEQKFPMKISTSIAPSEENKSYFCDTGACWSIYLPKLTKRQKEIQQLHRPLLRHSAVGTTWSPYKGKTNNSTIDNSALIKAEDCHSSWYNKFSNKFYDNCHSTAIFPFPLLLNLTRNTFARLRTPPDC